MANKNSFTVSLKHLMRGIKTPTVNDIVRRLEHHTQFFGYYLDSKENNSNSKNLSEWFFGEELKKALESIDISTDIDTLYISVYIRTNEEGIITRIGIQVDNNLQSVLTHVKTF